LGRLFTNACLSKESQLKRLYEFFPPCLHPSADMKSALFAGILLLASLCSAKAEYIAWSVNDDASVSHEITLQKGDTLKLITCILPVGGTYIFNLMVTFPNTKNFTLPIAYGSAFSPESVKGTVFVGPCTIKATNLNVLYVTFKKSTALEVAGVVPSSAVAVPNDTNGPVNLILETTDNLASPTWAPAQPGTYGVSSIKRFFRLRAVATN